jgi:hypothetical protein
VRFASQAPSFLTVGDLENVAVWPGLGNMRIAAALLHSKVEVSPRGARENRAILNVHKNGLWRTV